MPRTRDADFEERERHRLVDLYLFPLLDLWNALGNCKLPSEKPGVEFASAHHLKISYEGEDIGLVYTMVSISSCTV